MIAGAAFKQAWKMLGHDDDAPDATDQDRTWQEVLLAAAVQGAIFAAVKAAAEEALVIGGGAPCSRARDAW